MAKALDGTWPPTGGRPLRVEIADTRHLAQMAKLFRGHDDADLTEPELAELFAWRMASAGAVLGYLGDELIGCLWWADAEAMPRVEPLLNVRFGIRLGAHDVYAFGLLVAPEHRAEGISTWFLTSAEAELGRLGYNRLFGYVLRANRAARWLFAITGHQSVGPFTSYVLLSRLLRVNGALYVVKQDGFERVAFTPKERGMSGPRRWTRRPG
jgi:GNAT superfamily N-acetyltransferase